jgi:hypothetical protein
VVKATVSNPPSYELSTGNYVRFQWVLERAIQGFVSFAIVTDSAHAANTLNSSDKITAYAFSGDSLGTPIKFTNSATDGSFPMTSDSVAVYSSVTIPSSYRNSMKKVSVSLPVGNIITLSVYYGGSVGDKLRIIPIITTN